MGQPHTFKEKAEITAGAVAALVIVGWIVVLSVAFLRSCAAVLQHVPCSLGWNYSFDSSLTKIWLSL